MSGICLLYQHANGLSERRCRAGAGRACALCRSASSWHERERTAAQHDDEEDDRLNGETAPRPHDRLTTALRRERGGGDPCHEQAEHATDKPQNEPADLEPPAHRSRVVVWVGGRSEEGERSILTKCRLLLAIARLLGLLGLRLLRRLLLRLCRLWLFSRLRRLLHGRWRLRLHDRSRSRSRRWQRLIGCRRSLLRAFRSQTRRRGLLVLSLSIVLFRHRNPFVRDRTISSVHYPRFYPICAHLPTIVMRW